MKRALGASNPPTVTLPTPLHLTLREPSFGLLTLAQSPHTPPLQQFRNGISRNYMYKKRSRTVCAKVKPRRTPTFSKLSKALLSILPNSKVRKQVEVNETEHGDIGSPNSASFHTVFSKFDVTLRSVNREEDCGGVTMFEDDFISFACQKDKPSGLRRVLRHVPRR